MDPYQWIKRPVRAFRTILHQGRRYYRRQLANRCRHELQSRLLPPLLCAEHDVEPLTQDQQTQFRELGYLSPFTLCPPEQMREIRSYLRRDTLTGNCPIPGYPVTKWRHLDDVIVYALCAHPAIRERIAQLLGPNLLLWQSNLFDKPPGSSEIPWHQDRLFLELGEGVNLSAWLAIDDVDLENACVQIVPGSHRTILRQANEMSAAGDASTAFGRMADPAAIDPRQAVPIVLRAGQFMLFDEYLLHRSEPNRSRRQRLGLAVRYTTPAARIVHQLDGYHAVLVRGTDTDRQNRLGLPPAVPPGFRWPPSCRPQIRWERGLAGPSAEASSPGRD